MNTLLFSDIPQNDPEVMKNLKLSKIISVVMCVLTVGLGVACAVDALCMEGHLGEDVLFALFAPFMLLALWVILFVYTEFIQHHYLLVYEDTILYKKGFSRVEKRIAFDPQVCKIKIVRYQTRGGYINRLSFLDENNRCILRYTLCSSYSVFQDLKRKLRRIRCELIYSKKYK